MSVETAPAFGTSSLSRERLRAVWFEDGRKRWNVWNMTDELRVLEERLHSIAYAGPFDIFDLPL